LPNARKENWRFICGPDVDVAVRLRDEIARLGWDDDVDILFIDTTHEYEHTLQELKAYVPFLNSRSKIVLHDSNLGVLYRRKDGSFGFGFDNKRGVAHAVETYFNITFDEKRPYLNEVVNSLVIDHTPYSCGLTVISSLNNWGKSDN
jgi:cephalosporin hydroxylase